MRKADIIELISNNQQSWAPDIPPRSVAPPRPMRPNQTLSVRFRPDCPRQPLQSGRLRAPTQQEMDIFEQQEMSKSSLADYGKVQFSEWAP